MIEPLEFNERVRLASGELASSRATRAKLVAGLTAKQAGLLMTLVAHGEDGLTSKDFEAQLARVSGTFGIIGWSSSDCNVSLHRLEARGLVSSKRIGHAGRRGQARLLWHVTDKGERAFERYMDEIRPQWQEEVAWIRRASARALAEEAEQR